jgi:phage baseplate assembly protein V
VRGVISYVSDAPKTQTVQVELRFEDIADAIEIFQPFGLSFHPTIGSECLVLSVGASQDHLVAINATDRDNRPTGAAEGEGGLYTPSGWKVFLDSNGLVHIGMKDAPAFLSRDDRVQAELTKIQVALDAIAKAVPTQNSYVTVGPTAADKVKGL